MSRKDSKSIFSGILDEEPTTQVSGSSRPKSTSPHLQKVAAGVRHLQERGALAERVLKSGESIVDVDPETVDPSPFADRFDTSYEADQIAELIDSIRERGQTVPGIVRPKGDRFVIVSGRRRLSAARQLGIKFRAIIRELSDDEAIILQGEENNNRKDLSYIERCLFAFRLDKAGFKRDTIGSALSTSPSHLSEMLKVAAAVPMNILENIGSAPDIGRRRWMDLIEIWARSTEPENIALKALANRPGATSNERFQTVFAALIESRAQTSKGVSGSAPERHSLTSRGIEIGSVQYNSKGARMDFQRNVPKEFVKFVAARMESLHEEFLTNGSKSDTKPAGKN